MWDGYAAFTETRDTSRAVLADTLGRAIGRSMTVVCYLYWFMVSSPPSSRVCSRTRMAPRTGAAEVRPFKNKKDRARSPKNRTGPNRTMTGRTRNFFCSCTVSRVSYAVEDFSGYKTCVHSRSLLASRSAPVHAPVAFGPKVPPLFRPSSRPLLCAGYTLII